MDFSAANNKSSIILLIEFISVSSIRIFESKDSKRLLIIASSYSGDFKFAK